MDTPDLSPNPSIAAPARLRDAVGRTCVGFVKLGAVFLPEFVLGLLGGAVGLVVGVVLGVEMTAELFSGPGAWARAGPIALLLPVATALGPPFIGLWVGVVVPTLIALVPHSMVMAYVAWTDWRDRYAVLFLATGFAWLPGLLVLGQGVRVAAVVAALFAPFAAAFGFAAGAFFVAVRGVLGGHSLAGWWRAADGSMVLSMSVMTAYAWLVTVLVGGLFCFLPTVPFAVAMATACAVRLLRVRRHPALSIACLALGLLWSALAAVVLLLGLSSHGDG